MKPSPAGDWTLPIAYRREPGMEEAVLAELNTTWNGTFYSGPFATGNVTFPTFNALPEVNAVAVDFWPTEPTSLTETIAAVDVANWESITSRISFALDLDTQRNFTLFLPPSDALASALSLKDDDLTAFVSAHLVPSRVLLSLETQDFSTVSDKALSASATWVKVGSTNATITSRDILTNGGVLQLIDRSLA
ncbi:hypothetical protein BCR35DRAFT_307918 [Leucosporidium creatinivorum]|uniref:FAS1 domain-containing protein n=1 Tax=Leucosporidium creatinivorum TaxID=106004 RepID=A0A1Y2EGB7_9BASI|nr:hypothetical protein BCR35DRAFT_307918 [Leucosporidium creatinivorum]